LEKRSGSKNATTVDLNEKAHARLLGRTLPHVIHNDEERERLTNELLRLDEREDLSPEEKELAELLTVLIEEYEERRYPIRKASPQANPSAFDGGAQSDRKDLWKLLGSKGITSEVFHGKRAISKAQAKKLASFFLVGVELFI
jgi:HTH-type transcriptional regulator/antitoxin HigA